jgi:DNA-directed RNA polymerase beta subunit
MSVVEMPYAGKLLLQEITALNIAVEVVTEHSTSAGAGGK